MQKTNEISGWYVVWFIFCGLLSFTVFGVVMWAIVELVLWVVAQ